MDNYTLISSVHSYKVWKSYRESMTFTRVKIIHQGHVCACVHVGGWVWVAVCACGYVDYRSLLAALIVESKAFVFKTTAGALK